MQEIHVNSVGELFETVKKINKNNNYWFRGHTAVDYVLNPSAYRKLYVFEDQFGRPVEPTEIKSFSNRGDKVLLFDRLYLMSFLKRLNEENIEYDESMNLVDQYCLAQHYGVWTPMLDWTTDFSVALFFANDKRRKKQDCAVFLLDPKKWNEFAAGENVVFNSDAVAIKSNLIPLAMKGQKWDKRMCRQSGNFTVHGHLVWPLDHYTIKEDVLIKIIIPGDVADEIKEYLDVFGINRDSIYVEDDIKDTISKELKEINEETLQNVLEMKRKVWLDTPQKDRGLLKL